MKTFLSIFLIIFLLSCKTSDKAVSSSDNYKVPNKLKKFLLEFKQASLEHNSAKLVALLDREYKTEQLDGMHKGNTDAFLNELYCGKQTNGTGFRCIKYKTINYMKFIRAENNEEGYTVYYKLGNRVVEIETNWVVTIKTINSKRVYGIYGAVG